MVNELVDGKDNIDSAVIVICYSWKYEQDTNL